jgi:hypothetical protein
MKKNLSLNEFYSILCEQEAQVEKERAQVEKERAKKQYLRRLNKTRR